MTEFLCSPATVSVFLLTYLVHSTLAIVATGLVLRWLVVSNPELRVLLWKAALIVPVLTAFAVSLSWLPHFGLEFVISDPPPIDSIVENWDPSLGDHVDSEAVFTPAETTNRSAEVSLHTTSWERVRSLAATLVSDVMAFRPARDSVVWSVVAWVWIVGIGLGCFRLSGHIASLARLRRQGTAVTNSFLKQTTRRLARKMGIRRSVELIQSPACPGPLTGGIRHPFVLVPTALMSFLSLPEQRALLAHELAHVSRRDPLWNLIGHLISRIFFVQPLNRCILNGLRIEMEFVADQWAGGFLAERSELARCLARLAEWLTDTSRTPMNSHTLAVGMAQFHSILGRRVESLLNNHSSPSGTSRLGSVSIVALASVATVVAIGFAPRAVLDVRQDSPLHERHEAMTKPLTTWALLAGLALPVAAEDESKTQTRPSQSAVMKTTPDDLPEGIKGFLGGLVGRLVTKDVEKGSLLITVDAIAYTGYRNKAKDPRSAIGKTLAVDGIFGDILDRLVLINPGDTLRTGINHLGGNRLTWGGEDFWKVDPVQPGDYPELPEEFRGFEGVVVGKIVKKKQSNQLELLIRVDQIKATMDKSQAKNPASMVGKQIRVSGPWPDQQKFRELTVGDTIECGLAHKRRTSDDLTVTEFRRLVGDEKKPQEGQARPAVANATPDDLPDGVRGLDAVIVGRLVAKEVENGTILITVDAIHSIGPRSNAKDPKSAIGKTLAVDGYSGQILDNLVLIKPGETVLTYVMHTSGDRLRWHQEALSKVDPVQPGDYPEIPEGFRGFQGVVVGKIVKKKSDGFELLIRVDQVKATADKSQAKDPASILGKNVRVSGFWQHQDKFRELNVGDTIECGLAHLRRASDDAVVSEFRRQIGDSKPVQDENKPPAAPAGPAAAKITPDDFPEDMKGFNGMLLGRLAAKDVENGTFLVTIDAIPFHNVPRSQARDPKSALGRTLAVDGLSGEFLDRLLLIKPGETLYFSANQTHRDWLTFGGEGFQKVDPVQPGDYPEMLGEFRGFQGVIVGTIVKKNVGTMALIVRVDKIKETSEKSQATNPDSIVGKEIRIVGFGPLRDKFNESKVGERIECGLEHVRRTTDYLTVAEPVRHVGDTLPNGEKKD